MYHPLATSFTKFGERDMRNKKPFRTKKQKQLAKKLAVKTKDGYYVSPAPKSYHPK